MKPEKIKLQQQFKRAKEGIENMDIPLFVRLACYTILTLISLSAIIPLILVFSASITENTTLAINGYHLIPQKFSMSAYEYVLKNSTQVWNAYGITIMVTVIGTTVGLLCMTLFAYVISRSYFPWSNQFAFFIYFTMLFNGGMVPTYIVVSNVLHLRDTLAALILPTVVNAMYIMILRTYMRTSIPPSVVESAKIDGAGEFMCYYKIVLPMAVPSIATIALFVSVAYWNAWYDAFLYITSNERIMPIQLLLKRIENDIQFLATSSDSGGYAENERLREMLPTESFRMALVILVVLPILVAYPFFQRFFIKGMTVGAVKG